jgi:hypothetical protein
MTRAYNVIDADGHILEPFDLWNIEWIDTGTLSLCKSPYHMTAYGDCQ